MAMGCGCPSGTSICGGGRSIDGKPGGRGGGTVVEPVGLGDTGGRVRTPSYGSGTCGASCGIAHMNPNSSVVSAARRTRIFPRPIDVLPPKSNRS
ncbi:hypothetical protein CH260_19435 [Rhodococcus sp. 05-2256-B2]|nr:hypothetical protein CH258_04460 [Rhodococcus sp. 05-2256-B4]OZD92981.1 hypothetical protein CH260_19435 [Rhodococcus sp. 05-2256-B2]OZD95642.1 hypothetical protein CH257_06415 [Rhodococcus sp. 05-2256-B3]